VVDSERAEALLYLAGYYKEQGLLSQAELLCSRYIQMDRQTDGHRLSALLCVRMYCVWDVLCVVCTVFGAYIAFALLVTCRYSTDDCLCPFPSNRLMDKVGSEGDEARAMMREIRTLCLKAGGQVTGILNSAFPRHSNDSEGIFSTTFNNANKSFTGFNNVTVEGSVYGERYGANESKSSFIEHEHDESSLSDARRIEGDLSMSISGSEGGGGNLGLDDSEFRSP
jgi:hypothetical protein